MKRRLFIDDEADEGESDEEDGQEIQFDNEESITLIQQHQKKREEQISFLNQRLNRILQLEAISEHYQEEEDDDEESTEPEDIGPVESEIWRVPCIKGKEKETVLRLMFKHHNQIASNMKTTIISVFYSVAVESAIFIEAEREQDVYEAIVDIVQRRKLDKLSRESCQELMNPAYNINVQEGQWVRVKKHQLYKSDLAKVIMINRRKRSVLLKVIPRKLLENKVVGPKLQLASTMDPAIRKCKLELFEQSHFIYPSIEVERRLAKIDGFDLLRAKMTNIQMNIIIKEDELQLFYPDVKDPKILATQAKTNLLNQKLHDFKIGDLVILRNQPKTVFTIQKVMEQNQIEVSTRKKYKNGSHQEFIYSGHCTEFMRPLKKYQSIVVIKGEHQNQQGYILEFVNNDVIVMADNQSFKIPLQWVAIHGSGETSHNQSLVHTLVRFGLLENEVGVVMRSAVNYLTVLTVDDKLVEIPTVKAQTIHGQKVDTNQFNESLNQGDSVRVLKGTLAQKLLSIRFIHHRKLFLYSQELGGIFLEDIDNCVLFDALKKRFTFDNRPLRQFLGKQINIVRGIWTGYKGYVTKVFNGLVHVQLLAKNITTKLRLDDIEGQEVVFCEQIDQSQII